VSLASSPDALRHHPDRAPSGWRSGLASGEVILMRLSWVVGSLLLVVGACGGTATEVPTPGAAKPKFETRWLRGISATEVKTAAQARGLVCQGPTRQGGTNVWTCGSGTPLVQYRVAFYGSAPLKLEYITATITQAGTNATTELVKPLFVALAGLHYDGGDAPGARAWVLQAIDAPGDTTFGPGKFRVSGDLLKMTLDIKAAGADW
jgi:hypothetical protein